MKEFKHREYSDGYQRIYWNGNAAADAKTATRVVVQVGPGAYHREIEFAWPAQRCEVENLERMLDAMLETGKSIAKAEIRTVLGITEPRR